MINLAEDALAALALILVNYTFLAFTILLILILKNVLVEMAKKGDYTEIGKLIVIFVLLGVGIQILAFSPLAGIEVPQDSKVAAGIALLFLVPVFYLLRYETRPRTPNSKQPS